MKEYVADGICGVCEKPILKIPGQGPAAYRQRKYCSPECGRTRLGFSRAKRDGGLRPHMVVPVELRLCKCCGKEIPRKGRPPSVYSKAVYCSTSCRERSIRKPLPVTKVCRYCGKAIAKEGVTPSMYGRKAFCGMDCWEAYRCCMDKGNKRNTKRIFAKYKKAKCEGCGVRASMLRSYGYNLHSHHIDGDPLNNDQSNHETLCAKCHHHAHVDMRVDKLPSLSADQERAYLKRKRALSRMTEDGMATHFASMNIEDG